MNKELIQKLVVIIVLNWNGKKYLRECFTSIFNQACPNYYKVIMVDNGSVDDSVEYVKKNFPLVKIIKLDKNYGFAKGNNVGIREALKDKNIKYIITLNNDVVVDKHWLKALLDVMETNEEIGSAQSKILFYSNKNTINNVGILIYKDGSAINRGINQRNIDYDKTEEIFGACAASALYRRRVLEETGLFDEDFFAYMEDVDLAWRLRLNGWKSFLAPKSIVYHIHSASSSSKKLKTFRIFLINRNTIFVLIKNLPFRYVLLFPINYVLLRLKFLKTKRDRIKDFKKNITWLDLIFTLVGSWISALYFLPSLIRKRCIIQKKKKIKKKELFSWFKIYSPFE